MSLGEEFTSRYSCDAPEYLPEELRIRLDFCSCLRMGDEHSVYLAADRESGEKQILKITEKNAPNNLGQEYQLLLKLDHPGIPRAFYYHQDEEEREYLLRAYAKGDTLKSLLERDGVFGESQVLEIAYKLCEILGYLHSQTPPVIYRDITPDNIVLTPNGRLSLIDFGISRQVSEDKNFDTVYLGSTAFASPEQFGFTKTDARSDIFAIGKLMIYLATGETELQSYSRLIESGGLKAIIARCTRLSPEKRYSSVTRLARAIKRQLAPPTRKEYLIAAIVTLLVVAVGIFGGLFLLRPAAEDDQQQAPVRAEGGSVGDEVKIPVYITAMDGGKVSDDCAVAVDNHHWFQPAADGSAKLFAYAFDNYSIRAVSDNRTVIQDAAVTGESKDLDFTLDLALVPKAPEYLLLEEEYTAKQEIPVAVTGAEKVTLTGEPPGVSVVRSGSGFTLLLDKVEQPGHYTIFAEWSNEQGIADTVISLNLTDEKREITYIKTAKDLDRIRKHLTGHYVLANDIDLSEFGDWEEIGSQAHPFVGIFDGNGHEISGLTITEQSGMAGLFGYCERARISNVIMREPDIQAVHANGWGVGALAGVMEKGLVENCIVLGGTLTTDTYYYSSTGGICGKNGGIIRSCFNTADITVTDVGRSQSDSTAGGISGENYGYIIYCGNTGAVSSVVMAGGITGFCDGGYVTRSYNAGSIQCPTYYGDFPAGGVAHLLGRGYRISYCAFETGTAPVGATVWNRGTLLSIKPLAAEAVKDAAVLNDTLLPGDAEIRFVNSDLVKDYPIPDGIIK